MSALIANLAIHMIMLSSFVVLGLIAAGATWIAARLSPAFRRWSETPLPDQAAPGGPARPHETDYA